MEASGEKHLPVVTMEEGAINVRVGSVNHPMLPEHFIEWVYVQTEHGGQRKALKPGDDPSVTFCLGDDKAVAVYAYCNLHGMWMTELYYELLPPAKGPWQAVFLPGTVRRSALLSASFAASSARTSSITVPGLSSSAAVQKGLIKLCCTGFPA